jgi:hypothetical protein
MNDGTCGVGLAFAYDLRSPASPIQQGNGPHSIELHRCLYKHRAKVSGQRLISGGVTDAMVRAILPSTTPLLRGAKLLNSQNAHRKQQRSRTATTSTTSTPVRGVRDKI